MYASWRTEYSASITDCGDIVFQLFDANDLSIDDPKSILNPFATYDAVLGLRIHTLDQSLHGDYIIKVNAQLSNYSI